MIVPNFCSFLLDLNVICMPYNKTQQCRKPEGLLFAVAREWVTTMQYVFIIWNYI